MIRLAASILAVTLCCGGAQAGERLLTAEEITAALAGHIFVGAEPGSETEQIFQVSGVTLYTERGSQSTGFWKVENGRYCSVWPPSEHWSCYGVAQDGSLVIFLSSAGGRTVMRQKDSAQ